MVNVDYLLDPITIAEPKSAPRALKDKLELPERQDVPASLIEYWDNDIFWANFHLSFLQNKAFLLLIFSNFVRERSYQGQTPPM
jgi:hypothetical protein